MSGFELNILLLEDDEIDQLSIKRNLADKNYKITVESSLEGSLIFLENNSVDAILCDLNVDDSMGITTFEKLFKQHSSIPFIILSGYSEDDLAIEAVKKGAQDFIRKKDITNARISQLIQFSVERNLLLQRVSEAEEEARRQSIFKSNFLRHFSHEIRTPLNAMLGSATIILNNNPKKEQVEHLDNLLKGGDRLLDIIDDLIEISSTDSRNNASEYEKINISEEIQSILSLYEHKLSDKKIVLCSKFEKNVPKYINIDRAKINKIIKKLFDNSFKYTEEGYIKIFVTFDAKNKLIISVKDTGVGIDEDVFPKLFIPFHQNKSTEMHKGSGLGLAVCKKIITDMQGEIFASKKFKKGACLTFSLPVKKHEHEEKIFKDNPDDAKQIYIISKFSNDENYILDILSENFKKINVISIDTYLNSKNNEYSNGTLIVDDIFLDSATIESLAIKAEHNHKKIYISNFKTYDKEIGLISILHHNDIVSKINDSESKNANVSGISQNNAISINNSYHCLVVDDDETNRLILSSLLKKISITSILAVNGLEATKIIEKNQNINLIFMDCSMPIMDGIEATKRIRKNNSQILIMAATAHAFDEEKKKCFDAGMNYFLTKPIKLKMIKEVLNDFETKGFQQLSKSH